MAGLTMSVFQSVLIVAVFVDALCQTAGQIRLTGCAKMLPSRSAPPPPPVPLPCSSSSPTVNFPQRFRSTSGRFSPTDPQKEHRQRESVEDLISRWLHLLHLTTLSVLFTLCFVCSVCFVYLLVRLTQCGSLVITGCGIVEVLFSMINRHCQQRFAQVAYISSCCSHPARCYIAVSQCRCHCPF